MTEIQWLCDILLNHKLAASVKDRIIARIGEVEANLSIRPMVQPMRAPPIMPGAQAASTQRLLEQHELHTPPLIKAPGGPIDKETGTVVVATGNGTRGPRKF